jgi:Asp-tRNA(Asn)/Glu-tRNA(Gln) amidotransferase C subunit
MSISVDKIAALAYLKLSESEKSRFQDQFDGVLNYVKALDEVKMSAEEAKGMANFHILSAFYSQLGIDPIQSLRDENGDQSVNNLNLTNQEALQNAPTSSGLPDALMYEVPSIIERS